MTEHDVGGGFLERWRAGRIRALAAAVALATAAVSLVGPTSAAHASTAVGASDVAARTWGVNGRVLALAPAGSVVVVGGAFDALLGPSGDERAAGSVALFRPATGTFDTWPVTADGPVNAIAVDGDTVYLGGDFRHVNGVLRTSLAAVSLSQGTLLPWAPAANVAVDALAVSGGDVYIGGPFDTVTDAQGPSAVPYLARLSASDGSLDRTWSTSVTLDAPVHALLANADGSGIFVGGDFGPIGGQGYAARLTLLSTGPTAAIDPTFRSGTTNQSTRAPAHALALDGGSLLVGASGAGGGCTLQDAVTGENLWSYHTTGDVAAVAFLGPMAYCGGHFSGSGSFADQSRYKLAEVVAATGQVTSFAPRVDSALGVFALAASPAALFAGGDFTKLRSTVQPHLGMFVDGSAVSVPGTPGGLAARPGDGQVVLTWDRPDTDGGAPIRKFKIYRTLGSGKRVLLAKTKNLSFVDTTAVDGTPGDPASTYSYAVRAVNKAGTSVWSATVTAVPQAGLLITPSAPQDFTATGTLAAAVLAWTAPVTDGGTPVTAYQVLRGTTPGSLLPLTSLPADARGYSDADTVVGTRYYYAVAAVNAIGPGVMSKEASATPNTGVPGAPTLTASDPGDGSGIVLDWVASPNSGASPVARYILVRDGVRIFRGGSTTFDYTDATVLTGHTYRYQVKAVNSYGSSAWSNTVTVTGP